MKRRILLIAALGLIVACDRKPEAIRDAAGNLDPCALLTVRELKKAVGVPFGPGEMRLADSMNQDGRSTVCLWRATQDSGPLPPGQTGLSGVTFVMLNAWTWPKGSSGAAAYIQRFREAGDNHEIAEKPVEIAGLGEEAVWWGNGVAARKGDVSFGISVRLGEGVHAAQRPIEEALARRIAARL